MNPQGWPRSHHAALIGHLRLRCTSHMMIKFYQQIVTSSKSPTPSRYLWKTSILVPDTEGQELRLVRAHSTRSLHSCRLRLHLRYIKLLSRTTKLKIWAYSTVWTIARTLATTLFQVRKQNMAQRRYWEVLSRTVSVQASRPLRHLCSEWVNKSHPPLDLQIKKVLLSRSSNPCLSLVALTR